MPFIPSPHAMNRTGEIWADYRRGLLSPKEMIQEQHAEMQPCIEHPDRPGIIIVMDQPRCLECYERLLHEGAV